MTNVYMSGLKLFRVTIHAQESGRVDLLVKMIGENGGAFLMMVFRLDICISSVKTTSPSTQLFGLL